MKSNEPLGPAVLVTIEVQFKKFVENSSA